MLLVCRMNHSGGSRVVQGMRRPTTRRCWTGSAGAIGAVALAVALVGCGSDGDESGGSDASPAGNENGSALVSTEEMDGLGSVLVDSTGRALYFADEEADGTIRCVDACLGFWTPAEATGAVPTDISGLETVRRDDTGVRQLTYDGAPLYTFSLDKGPGQVTGDDLTDSFGGVEFTWHVAVSDEAADSGDTDTDTDDSDTDDGGGDPYDYGGGDPYGY
jgi:predicted lipoprotein with Yx(FWY)xxD motif